MGWFDTVLGLTSVALDVATLSRIQKMDQAMGNNQLQAAMGAAWEAFIHDMKNQVFNFRQAAKEVLKQEDDQPLISAGAMKLLEANLDDSPVTAEIFPDLADKEYVNETVRLIRDNAARMMSSMSAAERNAVFEMLQASQEYSRLNYYIENYEDGYRLSDAEDTVARLKGRNQSNARLGLGCGLGLAVFVLWGLISTMTNPTTGLLFILFIGVPGFVGFNAWQGRKKYEAALKVVQSLDDQIDQDLFAEVDGLMDGSLPKAKKAAAANKRIVDRFFAGQAMLPPGSADIETGETQSISKTTPDQAVKTLAAGEILVRQASDPVDGIVENVPKPVPVVQPVRPPIKFCAMCGADVLQPDAKICSICGEELLR